MRALTGTDPDRLKEEKARGITIDLGFAHATVGGIDFAFVDVPGHERFVKNMLAGAGGVDMVVLVVAADESVMPQTREHFDICRLLRVPAGLVALTKVDVADAETLDLARMEIGELVAGSFLEGAPVIPVSARDGTGLDDLREALVRIASQVVERRNDGATRLPIDRVFSMRGFGTVVTGTLASGSIAVDREMIVLPGGRRVKVRGVQVHSERRAEARAGQRTAVNLGGVDVQDVERGQNLVEPDAFVETRVADASVQVLGASRPLRHGARIRFHQGTVEIIGRVGIIDPAAAAIEPGASGFVRLRLESPAVLARGDRYILRAYSPPMTIAGGAILDPMPLRGRIRSRAALERCAALHVDEGSTAKAVPYLEGAIRAAVVFIREAGAAGLPIGALMWRAGVDPVSVQTAVQSLTAGRQAVTAGDVLAQPDVVEALEASIAAALAEHHRAQPLSEGIPREELRTTLFKRGHAAIFDRALESLAARGRIVIRDRVALAGHRVEMSADEEHARWAIERAYKDGGLTPPDAASLAALGLTPAISDRVTKLLLRQKVLVRVDTLTFHAEALAGLKADLAGFKAERGASARLDVATFKERFGVTRKFAIPLLEYLDRERVTRRAGDSRVLL